MKLWISTLVYKDIITGHTINWARILRVFRCIEDECIALKESGHSLLIGSIFERKIFADSEGNIGLFPDYSGWQYQSISALKQIINSGIEFEVIGDKIELEYLQNENQELYNKVLPHIVWKGKKRK